MNAVRQSCRPKHQVLILKCYPRYQKSQTQVKPNGSELSYLLYYASTRRSKLQKVGGFLEKRTVSDVWHQRVGNVQVTVEILRALIEKCYKDLPLFAGSVLRTLRTILKSEDVTMVECTGEVWETFCKHQDPAMLAADQEYIRQYEEIVQLYVNFASKDKPQMTKGMVNLPVSIRFRKIGLEAIKGIAESDTINADTARQLNLMVPVVLENLYSTDPTYLHIIHQREYNREQLEKEQAYRRRQSISTVRTAEEEADPAAALGTTADADKLAEQDVAILAFQALRKIFSGSNRGRLRLATSAALKFTGDHVRAREHFETQQYVQLGSWPTNLFYMLCGWAPVQDRFVILVTAMETLVRSPIVESDLQRQYVLAIVISWLLSSNINFIGLSVMDVLVGLMQHISLLLQLGGQDSDIKPHHQQFDVLMSDTSAALKDGTEESSVSGQHRDSNVVMEVVKAPSEERVKLLNQLLQCIGNLATHVYYTDQISDMITAIMKRLRPFPQTTPSAAASAIQDPSGTADSLARSVSLHEKPGTDNFFSFDTARVAALQAVKAIIAVSNSRAPDGSSNASGRSQIGTSVWEGTQWLLRDPNFQVRLAYHDALATWLSLESRKNDLKVEDEAPKRKQSQKKENGAAKEDSLARRAVSNATQREKSPAPKRSTFLDLLHLAIYENAHQYAESEQDILLLHSLLCILVQKLGVNSVRSGLPMIMCLQRETPTLQPATARVNVGSLVHGYFWAVAVYFDFDASATARTILNEITRRTHNGVWLQSVRVPPLPPQHAPTPQSVLGMPPRSAGTDDAAATENQRTSVSDDRIEGEALKPFDNRPALVDKISQGYSMALYSPPASPPSSPSRSFSVPILAQVGRSRSLSIGQNANLRAPSPSRGPPELPPRIREDLLSDWSKEGCVANTMKMSAKSTKSVTDSGKLSGSAGGDSNLPRVRSKKHLAVAGAPEAGTLTGNGSLNNAKGNGGEYLSSPLIAQQPGTPTNSTKARRSVSRGATPSPGPLTTSSVRSAVRVEDLKRVLAGATASGGALRTAWSMRGPSSYGQKWNSNRSSFGEGDADTASDSLVSADASTNEEADYAVPVTVNVPVPPGVDDVPAGAGDEEHRDEAREQEQMEREIKEGSATPRPTAAGHSHAGSEDTIRPLLNQYNVGSTKPASADAQDEYIPPVPPLPESFLREERGRQWDTDAESSIYMTPAESPAPPLSRMNSNKSTATETARGHGSYFDTATVPPLPRPDTPPRRLEAREEAQTPRGHEAQIAEGEATMITTYRGQEVTIEPSKRRSSAHSAQTPTRKSMTRSSSSGTPEQTQTPRGGAIARQSQKESMRGNRTSSGGVHASGSNTPGRGSMRVASGGSYTSYGAPSSAQAAAGSDVRSLLEGIDADGYRYGHGYGSGYGIEGVSGRPPY